VAAGGSWRDLPDHPSGHDGDLPRRHHLGRLAPVSELAPRPYQAYDPDTDEASAFEMQVASHGALSGPQSLGFLLYPSGFQAPPDPIVGAEDLHRVLLGWRTGLVESGSAFGGGVRSVDA